MSDVPEESMKLNVDLYAFWTSSNLQEKKETQYIKMDKSNVVLDAFKLDEEDMKNIIMRVHENVGTECRNRVEFSFPIGKPQLVNILEEPIGDWEVVGKDSAPETPALLRSDSGQVYHLIKPFQIFTMKVAPIYK